MSQTKRVLSREEIAKAVKCDNWQNFRQCLKQLETLWKLIDLQDYQSGRLNHTCCDQDTKDIQVLNYLNALARGGQIKPLPNDFVFERTPYGIDRLTLNPIFKDWTYRLTILK